MNHAGEITPLTAMVRPHVAIITTVAPVHLEFFPSVEAIADAKAEIFSGLEPGGVAILNRDNPHFERLDAAARRSPAGLVSTFGAHESRRRADSRVHAGADHSTDHRAMIVGRERDASASARRGAISPRTALAVLLAAHAVGADLEEAAATLAFFQAQQGRGERVAIATPDGPITLIDESYNANPASMRAALSLAGTLKPGRRRPPHRRARRHAGARAALAASCTPSSPTTSPRTISTSCSRPAR